MKKGNNRTNRSRKNTRRGRNRPTQVVLSRRDPSFPPAIKSKPIINRTLRYQNATALTEVAITRRCLLNLVLAGTNASTTAVNVYEAVRLDRIHMYFSPSSSDGFGGVTSEISLTWGGDRGPDVRTTDRGTISHPACIKQKPPPFSLGGFWSTIFGDMDETLFLISAPINTIVDLHLSMCMGDGAGKTCVIVDPALSGIIYCALDNAIPAGTVGNEFLRPDALTFADMTTP